MERKSLFEKMKERKIVYIDEIIKSKILLVIFQLNLNFKKFIKWAN